jgi:hypothetical protein
MSEGKMKELNHLEEGSKAIHEPMFIVFGDASTKIDIVEKRRSKR